MSIATQARTAAPLVLAVLLLGCVAVPQAGTGQVILSTPAEPPEPGLDNFGVVEQGVLYRGAEPTVNARLELNGFSVLLSKYKIRTVIDLMNEPVDHWILRRERDCAVMTGAQRNALRYVRLPSYEAFPNRSTLTKILRIVETPGNQPVFVHCSAGQNRTGAIIAGFRVVQQHWDPIDAKAEMTNFHVLRIWKWTNDKFIDELARDRQALRDEVQTAGQEPVVVTCDRFR
jgi:hypothetical protein